MTATTMERKSFKGLGFKQAGAEGSFRATYATFSVVDHDRDVTEPGAFESGAPVRIAGFGHDWANYVIGDGVIGADSTKAWVDGEFYLTTSRGRDTYESVKRLGAKGLQDFSYGYEVTRYSIDPAELAKYPGAVRILKQLKVHEVSPVMLGAGIGTGVDSIKAHHSTGISSVALEQQRQRFEEWWELYQARENVDRLRRLGRAG